MSFDYGLSAELFAAKIAAGRRLTLVYRRFATEAETRVFEQGVPLASAAVPRTRLSNGVFCDIAYPPDNR
jgi:hypothetical protein